MELCEAGAWGKGEWVDGKGMVYIFANIYIRRLKNRPGVIVVRVLGCWGVGSGVWGVGGAWGAGVVGGEGGRCRWRCV